MNAVPPPTPEARRKLAQLETLLRGYGSVIVAYSGGVDSTFLAAIAGKALGAKALAVTADSESLAPEELRDATEIAARFGFRHEIVKTAELSNPAYAANPQNRCYFCKAELMQKLSALQTERGIACVALGATVDDLADIRPGETAAKERGAVFPLREAGLGKAEIRSLSQEFGLPTWDKPGAACLSSRIPFGEAVTAEKLAQIAQGEAVLHTAGFRECRLRSHSMGQTGGPLARIEVPLSDLPALLARQGEITAALKALGFIYITVDLQGLRSGSLHDAVKHAPVGE